ncbi:hypothetical protein P7C70_g8701, partial [Phenoliferia sp. Uapishka_3]
MGLSERLFDFFPSRSPLDSTTITTSTPTARTSNNTNGQSVIPPPHSAIPTLGQSTPMHPFSPASNPPQALASLSAWSAKLEVRSDLSIARGNKGKARAAPETRWDKEKVESGGSGSVILSRAEVLDLVSAINANLEGPITRNDLLSLLQQPPHLPLPSPRKLQLSAPSNWAAAYIKPSQFLPEPQLRTPPLPTDILNMIFEHLRIIRATSDEEAWISRTGTYTGWRELRKLAMVSKAWSQAASPLYLSELHIEQSRELPLIARRIGIEKFRGEMLTKLYVKLLGFEGGRTTNDAGFALPDILSQVPNLRVLGLGSDRLLGFSRGGRAASDIESFVGVHLPTCIITSVPLLRTLIYGVPFTLSDVQAFTTQLPELRTLDMTGDIPDLSPPTIPFEACQPNLRRLWLPTTTLTTVQLEALLSPSSQITSLGFMFDLDDYHGTQPATEEQTTATLENLVNFFDRVGPSLKELLIATPQADLPELGPRLRIPGGWGGAGAGIQIAFQAIHHVQPPPGLNPPPPAGAQPPAPAAPVPNPA